MKARVPPVGNRRGGMILQFWFGVPSYNTSCSLSPSLHSSGSPVAAAGVAGPG